MFDDWWQAHRLEWVIGLVVIGGVAAGFLLYCVFLTVSGWFRKKGKR